MIEKLDNFKSSYFDFNYVIGAMLFIVFFLIYLYMEAAIRRKEGQEKKIGKKDVLWGMLLCGYFVLLFGVTLLNRTMEEKAKVDLQIFWSYIQSLQDRSIALGKQILYNILAFIPLGILLPAIYVNMRRFKRIVLTGSLLSVFIEANQWIWHCGLCELDDVISNTIGTVLGYLIFLAASRVTLRLREDRK